MNILSVINDAPDFVSKYSKFEWAVYSAVFAALIILAFWTISKIVKFVFKVFRRK